MSESTARRQAASEAQPAGATGQKRILLVDDSSAMRRIVRRKLVEAGFDDAWIVEAGDGQEALATAQRLQPDVVVADFNMPQMDGLSLHRGLRAAGQRPFFLLLSSEAQKLRAQASLVGVDFVLAKPVTSDSLREALAPLVESGRLLAPCAERVHKLLRELLGREAIVKSCYRAVLAGSKPVLIGCYGDGNGSDALIACDMELAAHLGAAIAEKPAAWARECVRAGAFSAEMMETLQEFLSVCGSLFTCAGCAPLTLQGVHVQLRQLPPKSVALAVSPRAQAVFEVDICGFGSGGMSISIG